MTALALHLKVRKGAALLEIFNFMQRCEKPFTTLLAVPVG
jgi:hypothetical protein